MAAVALGERSINAAPTPPRRGVRSKAVLGGYRGAPRGVDGENTVRTPPSARSAQAADSPGVGMARFDSLQDLLQKAGYKETRVFTPITTIHANGQGSPPASGSSAREALQGKASTLGRKPGVQEAAETARRNTSSMGKAAGAWFAAVWGVTTAPREEPPLVPALPSSSTYGGTNTTPPPATSADALKSVQQSLATRTSRGQLRQAASSPPTTAIVRDPAPSACVTAASSPILARTGTTTSARSSPRRVHVAAASSPGRSPRKRLVALPRRSGVGSPASAGRNSIWSASLRYRAANNAAGRGAASKSVPARNVAPVGTQNGAVRLAGGAKSKMRRSLVDAFGGADGDSPTKAHTTEQAERTADEMDEPTAVKGSDAAEMRRLRNERREWRESISSLKAFAASSSSASGKEKAPLQPSSLSRSASPVDDDASPTKSRANKTGAAPLSDLFARAAAPLVSRDDAVVLRSADCLWPAGGNGLRRMRSVEALERAVASMRTGTTGSSLDASVALANGSGEAPLVDPQKSPEVVRAPPALMLTSPTGQSGAQLIDLGAKEFEPRSLSPEQLRLISIVRPPSKPKTRSMIPKRSGIYSDAAPTEEDAGASSSSSASSSVGSKRGRKRMPKATSSDADSAAAALVSPEPSLMAPRSATRQRGRKQRNRSKSSASSTSSAEEAPSVVAVATDGAHRINALRRQPRPASNVADDPFVVAPSAVAPASAPAPAPAPAPPATASTSTGRGNVQRNAAKARRNAEASASAVAVHASPTKATLSRSSGRTALAKAAVTATAVPTFKALTMSPETVRAASRANTDSPSAALAKRSKSRVESRIPIASP